MNGNENRVLSFKGARELTPEEVMRVTGARILNTNVCTINLATGQGDGDGCGH
jgi:hypothetical protein